MWPSIYKINVQCSIGMCVQGQVTRAQEAEERFTLRNEVATLRRILSTKTSNDTQSDEDGERSKSAEGDETVVKVNGKEENDDDIIDGDDKEQELTEKPETTEVCVCAYAYGI